MGEPKYPMLHQAALWATECHLGQDRDGESPLPYITHPLEVLSALRVIGGVIDEAMLCAAVLHDVVEECNVSPDELSKRTNKQVCKLVLELTREEPSAETIANMDADAVYALRSELLLNGIRAMSKEAQHIKLADRLCNLRDSERTRKGKKRERYRRQSAQILEIISRKVGPDLWDAIDALLRGAKN